ncbi:MAG TPA: hypothetical protein VGM39_03960 [Kofleriaceae bacterium]
MLGTCELPGTAHDGGPDGPVDAPIDAVPLDANPTCSCSGDTLTCGDQSDVDCPQGCNADPHEPRCNQIAPSNGLVYTPATTVNTDITVLESVFVNTDTGEIDGTLFHRDPGEGEKNGIIFSTKEYMGAPLGVFWLRSLSVKNTITVGGDRALVVITSGPITIESNGKFDVSAGCDDMNACPGPGGGVGAYDNNAATGCAPGTDGTTTNAFDSGGGGGGGGGDGAKGGDGNAATNGGSGGMKCMSTVLEPLTGGSGGGRGGITTNMLPPNQAGGGGGGIQLTSNTNITIRGTIDASGEGGSGGVNDTSLLGGGNGGGAGGGILLEAPSVTTFSTARLGANGGGGGAGGQTTQMDGSKGRLDGTAAPGGSGSLVSQTGAGGAGGTAAVGAVAGTNITNAGAGGGAVGVIVVRAQMRSLQGIISPAATTAGYRAH